MLCSSCSTLTILHTKKNCFRCKAIMYNSLFVLCDACANKEQVCNACLKKINKNIKNFSGGCRCGAK